MENAIDALHIGVSVLIFVLALSVSINAFGQARQTAQLVLDYSDREYDSTYLEYDVEKTQRVVTAETIIPSIYRAYRENYKIVFKDKLGKPLPLYEKKDIEGNITEIYSIDIEKDVVGDDDEKESFIRCLLYGKNPNTEKEIENFKNKGIVLKNEKFYDTIKRNKFKESIGVYYQEEIQQQSDEPNDNVPDANKTKKRVITYEVI